MTSYSKKTKCQGCKALTPTQGTCPVRFTCGLGVELNYDNISNAPAPSKKCYKPTTEAEYDALKKVKQTAKNEA